MLTDSELKTGNGLDIVLTWIRDECDKSSKSSKSSKPSKPTIYFAVFGALTKKRDLKITSLDDLEAGPKLRDLMAKGYLEDVFIAATMHELGIEPPLEVR